MVWRLRPYHHAMRVHHLNCGTMCPLSARLVNGEGGIFSPARMVCHCLLIETDDGLVLVDTGLGLGDIAAPRQTLGTPFLAATRPRLDPAETAARQVEQLGFAIDDVRHVVFTHLDPDHSGGLPDFPHARVHVLADEHDAAMHPADAAERRRYIAAHWAHGPQWEVHSAGGDRWMGFDSVQALGGDGGPEVLLIPLFGHTRGHCGVALRVDDGWLLHCGDAYFFHGEMDVDDPNCPVGLRVFQRITGTIESTRQANQQRLRELKRDHGGEVQFFCSHDAVELDRSVTA
jgi:glyoxylase-like metal-dependent hydrolase (beta-lactamase superfamily II)